jgi:hypothetical protein
MLKNKKYPNAWVQTYTGVKFYPIEPNFKDVYITDIAWSLSHQCRYTGHSNKFYSVAEHCIYVSEQVPQEFKLWGLLHDASEAYLSDIARPVKAFLPSYKVIENKIMEAVCKKFKMSVDMPTIVKEVDLRILGDEQRQFLPYPPESWTFTGKPLGITFKYNSLTPEEMYYKFLDYFEKYI